MLSVVLLLVAVTYGFSCSVVNNCVGEGEACERFDTCVDGTAACSLCQADSQCIPASSGSTSLVCVKNEKIEQRSCQSSSDCYDSGSPGAVLGPTYSRCEANFCVPRLGGTGDKCLVNSDCYSQTCDSATKKCAEGVALGGVCQRDEDCPLQSYCSSDSTRICTEVAPVGADCSTTSDLCGDFMECGLDDTCVTLYRTPAGRPCDDDEECAEDLTCVSDFCVFGVDLPSRGDQCNSTFGFSSTCGSAQNCECDHNSDAATQICVNLGNECAGQLKDFTDCARKAECNQGGSLSSPWSCLRDKCGDHYLRAKKCEVNTRTYLYPDSCKAGLSSAATLSSLF